MVMRCVTVGAVWLRIRNAANANEHLSSAGRAGYDTANRGHRSFSRGRGNAMGGRGRASGNQKGRDRLVLVLMRGNGAVGSAAAARRN